MSYTGFKKFFVDFVRFASKYLKTNKKKIKLTTEPFGKNNPRNNLWLTLVAEFKTVIYTESKRIMQTGPQKKKGRRGVEPVANYRAPIS